MTPPGHQLPPAASSGERSGVTESLGSSTPPQPWGGEPQAVADGAPAADDDCRSLIGEERIQLAVEKPKWAAKATNLATDASDA